MRGCNPKTRNDEGQTAKAIAKETGKKKLVREIVKAEKQYEKMQASLTSGDVCVTVSEPWALRLHDYVLVRKSAFEEEFARLDPEGDERIAREAFARAYLSRRAAPAQLHGQVPRARNHCASEDLEEGAGLRAEGRLQALPLRQEEHRQTLPLLRLREKRQEEEKEKRKAGA